MNKEDCFYFGYIVKPVSYDGTFAVKADTDNLQRYGDLKSILIDLSGTLTPFFISSAQVRDKEMIWLKAEGFNSEHDIQNILRKEVYLPLSLLPQLSGKQFYFHEIVGYTVIDEAYGDIGKVKDVMEMPQQTILQIMKGYDEILVPLNNDILHEVNRSEKTLRIHAPEGLIDIYLNKKNEHETETD